MHVNTRIVSFIKKTFTYTHINIYSEFFKHIINYPVIMSVCSNCNCAIR